MSSIIQRSFSSGEIAPSLYSRVDTVKYQTGLRTCKNFMVLRHGGVANRPGTTFVGEVKDSTKTVRLIPFVFNTDQTYVLEFGDQYMRVIRDGAQVLEATQNITGITQANPAVVTIAGHGLSNGQEVFITGVAGMTQVNVRNFKVANVTANTFELQYMNGTNVNSTGFGAYTSGGTAARVYTISTPYAEADLATLKFVQSADVITIAHPTYAPRNLSRSGHTNWTLSTITFAPSISAPTSVVNSGTAGSTTLWVVTAVASETFEESIASSSTGSSATPTSGLPITVSWGAVSGAQEYNVYKQSNGVYGFIGVAGSTSFLDNGITPDTTDTPPIARNPFGSSDNYPSVVNYYQQRLVFANTNNDPEKVWSSRTGQFYNFTTSSPLQDDDAVTFSLAGRQVNSIKNMIDLGNLLMFTASGEWVIQGDSSGILRPTDVNPRQHTYNGSQDLPPLIINGNALYVQARGSIIRDLTFDYQIDGYKGNDLTIFSSHLFDNYTISDWAYQQIPHSIVWAVRDDGVLLGLTYIKEQQIFGWHRHEFDGTVENVCVVPEGTEDAVYLTIKRTINGASKRYVERFSSRLVIDVIDNIFMESTLSYDGRNLGSQTMTLSGSGWTYTDTLTLTSSTSYFTAADVGNEIHLTGSDGTLIRFEIKAYSSATVVTGKPNKTVPVSMQAAAITNWAKAVDEVTGLWHLEGKEVSVFADRFVVANPNNESYDTITVTNGVATLDQPYSVIHVGIPYTSDIETLDVDTVQGETVSDKNSIVTKVSLQVESSRGIWIGGKAPDETVDFLDGLTELKIRNEEGYDDPVALATDKVSVIIRPEWNSNGRVFIRQTDPLPLTVSAITPAGAYPFRRNN